MFFLLCLYEGVHVEIGARRKEEPVIEQLIAHELAR
jgi:hypothetical protein